MSDIETNKEYIGTTRIWYDDNRIEAFLPVGMTKEEYEKLRADVLEAWRNSRLPESIIFEECVSWLRTRESSEYLNLGRGEWVFIGVAKGDTHLLFKSDSD